MDAKRDHVTLPPLTVQMDPIKCPVGVIYSATNFPLIFQMADDHGERKSNCQRVFASTDLLSMSQKETVQKGHTSLILRQYL